jgi:putative acetyltransferase
MNDEMAWSISVRRLARPADIESVHAIYMHPRVIPFLGHDAMPLEDFRAVFRALLASEDFFIYESAGQFAGFYKASRYAGRARHVACLGTLAINPALQGRGFGRAMVMDAIARLRSEGACRIELLVEADNAHAIGFYRRLGFEHEGIQRKAYKRAGEAAYVDELMMALLLE